MELRHLRYFVVLAEELHFGRAALRLHITQPPLSSTIRQLEEHLGTRLFIRDSRSVRLTPVGAAFLSDAMRVVAHAESAEQTGRELAAGSVGKLLIGFTSTMLYRGLPAILKAFRTQHPRLRVQLRDMTVEDQLAALDRRVIDGAFSTGQVIPEGLEGVAMVPDTFVCCAPEGHWATGRASVPLAELATEDFIVFIPEYTPVGYGRFLTMCLRAGFRPREAAHVRQWITAALLVAAGEGIAIVPESLRRSAIPQVRYVPLEGEDMKAPANFIWNPLAMSPALRNLIETTQRHARAGDGPTFPAR